jgi:hypothetical protein
MAAREKTDEEAVDHVLLPHDALRDLPRDVLNEPGVRRG